MNKERDSGPVLPVGVREGRAVGVTSEQGLNEMRDWAIGFEREKHLVQNTLVKRLDVLVVSKS